MFIQQLCRVAACHKMSCTKCVRNSYNNYHLTRLPSKTKAQMASGQGSHWLIESPTFLMYV